MNEQLEAMKEDGTLTAISEEFYSGEDVTQQIDYDFEEIDVSDE